MTERLNSLKKDTLKGLRSKQLVKRVVIIVAASLLLLALAAFVIVGFTHNRGTQDEYHDTGNSETAALEMKIDFERNCDGQENCRPDERSYDFLVFVFNEEGKQVRIIRGDSNGQFKTSMPEGSYTLVVSKAFEDIMGLPQETVRLENGKSLKLQRDYGKEVRK